MVSLLEWHRINQVTDKKGENLASEYKFVWHEDKGWWKELNDISLSYFPSTNSVHMQHKKVKKKRKEVLKIKYNNSWVTQ